MRNGFMKVRVERRTLRFDLLHAFHIQNVLELTRHQLNAICPGILGRAVLQSTFQVIEHG